MALFIGCASTPIDQAEMIIRKLSRVALRRLSALILLLSLSATTKAAIWDEVIADATDSNLSLGITSIEVVLLANLLKPKLQSQYSIDLQLELQRPEQADVLWLSADQAYELYRDNELFGPIAPVLPNYQQVSANRHPATIMHLGQQLNGYPVAIGLQRLRFSHHQDQQPPEDFEQLLAYLVSHKYSYSLPSSTRNALFAQTIYRLQDYYPSTQPINNVSAELYQGLQAYLQAMRSAGLHQVDNNSQMGKLRIHFLDKAEPARDHLLGALQQTEIIAEAVFVGVNQNAQAKAAAQVLINELLSQQMQQFMLDNGFFSLSVLDQNSSVSLPMPHPDWLDLMQQNWEGLAN